MGSTNNAPQQNAAANQQIGQNTAAAQANFQKWLSANPFPLQGISAPKGPTQTTGTAPAQNFGGASGGAQAPGAPPPGLMQALAMLAPSKPKKVK